VARNSPGEIRDAIVMALAAHQGDASVRQIHESVATYLGREVPASSVRSYLQLNTPGSFTRTSRGRYALGREQRQLELLGDGPSEIFSFGRSQLVRGDCFAWLAAREPNSIHAIVTDPPYGLVEYSRNQQSKLRSGNGGVWRIPPSFDGQKRSPLPRFTTLKPQQIDELRAFFTRWARSVLRVLTPGGHVMVASNPLLSYAISDALARGGLERRGEIIRMVMTMRGGDRPKNAHREFPEVSVLPRAMWEPWVLFRKPIEGRVQDCLRKWGTGGLRRISDEKPFGDVIRSRPTGKSERELAPHPSLKPQSFLRQLVRAALPLGKGVVLDTFAGSGSTLAAAEAIGYASIGTEMDPEYYSIAKEAIPALAAFKVKGRS
jgi:DNA modification methylase